MLEELGECFSLGRPFWKASFFKNSAIMLKCSIRRNLEYVRKYLLNGTDKSYGNRSWETTKTAEDTSALALVFIRFGINKALDHKLGKRLVSSFMGTDIVIFIYCYSSTRLCLSVAY